MDIESVPQEFLLTKHISKIEDINESLLSDFLKSSNVMDSRKLVQFIRSLYDFSVKTDATLIEINPFISSSSGDIICLDSKVSIDDNSFFRHKDIFGNHDFGNLSASETKAKKFDINYIGMEGNIACLVNGAGLAMATMDLIKHKGGQPANFLDIGGGATAEQVAAAIEIIGQEKQVNVIYVNIFGGIMRCDIIAEGIIRATKKLVKSIPIVIRLKGNNLEKAKNMLSESGITYKFLDDFDASANEAVKLSRQ